MTTGESDAAYMDLALALATQGKGMTSPNPMVGAVVVSANGRVIGAGFHARAGAEHAEVVALAGAGGHPRGATLYSTLEPCCHRGRTGPCVERIVEAGVARVVVGTIDPNPRVEGNGVRYLTEHGVTVRVGVRATEAERLNRAFETWVRRGRPFVTVKIAVSRDGCVAEGPGRRTALTSGAANRRAHELRAEVEAIGVGSETVLVDDPRLNVRYAARRTRPLTRVVFDRRLRVPPTAQLFSTLDEGPVWIVTSARAVAASPDRVKRLQDVGALVDWEDDGDLRRALERLGAREVTTLLLEGGVAIHRAAFAAGLVDRVQVYIAPVILGPGGVPWLGEVLDVGGLDELRVSPVGPDTLVEGYVQRSD